MISRRKFERQQNEPIGRQIELAAQRVRKQIAEHGEMIDDDRVRRRRATRPQRIDRGETAPRCSKASTAAAAKSAGNRTRRAGVTAAKQDRRREQGSDGKCHAADIGRAFEAGDDDQHQRQEPRGTGPLREMHDQHHRRDHAGSRHQMLRHPGGLEQPAGKAVGRRHERFETVAAEHQAQRRAQRCRRGESDHQDRGARSLAEPDGDAHHQGERGESGEPGQADIGFPAADTQRQRQLRRAEVPEVIIGQPPGDLAPNVAPYTGSTGGKPCRVIASMIAILA